VTSAGGRWTFIAAGGEGEEAGEERDLGIGREEGTTAVVNPPGG
jgi:hypothetical protein